MSNNVTSIEAHIMETAEKIHDLVESGEFDKYMDAIEATLGDRSVFFRDKVLRCCYSSYFSLRLDGYGYR